MKYILPDGLVIQGHILDALKDQASESINMVVTSPPYYGLRKYSGEQTTQWSDGQWAYGLEDSYDLPQLWPRSAILAAS